MARWLFVLGASVDLAGAALIAWTIYSRTSAETREEARTRYGGNLWVILFREREQAYVRSGLALLALGFTCQLVGYLSRFRFPTWLFAAFVAVAVFLAALFVAKAIAERVVPLHYRSDVRLPEGIEDERHLAPVETRERSLYGAGCT
jgi:hypothetical protein